LLGILFEAPILKVLSVEVDAGSMIKVTVGGGGGTLVERAGLM